MKLFKSPYRAISDEEAAENAAPRHGFVGFFVTLWEYLSELFRGNLLTVLCLLPACLLYILGRILFEGVLPVAFVSLLGSIPAGAGLCGLSAVAVESLRNRGYAFMRTYKKEFKANLKKGILPGCLYILSVWLVGYMLSFAGEMAAVANAKMVYVMLGVLAVLLQTLLGYMLPMMTLVELPARHYLKNSLLFMAACPKSTVGLMLVSTVVCFGIPLLLLPYTGIYLLLIGLAMLELSRAAFAWPVLNSRLRIEEREAEKHRAENR